GAVAKALDIEHDSRLLLYRIFDRHVMSGYPKVLERLDQLLDQQRILPGLTHVPVRARPTPQGAGEPRSQADAGGRDGPAARGGGTGYAAGASTRRPDGRVALRQHTRLPGTPIASHVADGESTAAGASTGRPVGRDALRPHTGRLGEPIEAQDDDDERVATEQLQQLLHSRRELLDKLRPAGRRSAAAVISTDEVTAALG